MTQHTDSSEPEERPERAQPREPMFNVPGVVLALIAACVLIHIARVYLLTRVEDLFLIVNYAFWPLRYTGGDPIDIYAFVSPFSYALLHGGAAHLIVNMIWLAAFGSPLAYRLGAVRFLLLWAVASLAAVALHFALHPYDNVPLVGASGAVSGMMGAAARFGFRVDRRGARRGFFGPVLPLDIVFRSRLTVVFLLVWMGVNLVVGLGSGIGGTPQIAWEAHIGGFLAGFLGIKSFDRSPERSGA